MASSLSKGTQEGPCVFGALLSILMRTDSHGFFHKEVHTRVAFAVFGLTLSDPYDFQLASSLSNGTQQVRCAVWHSVG